MKETKFKQTLVQTKKDSRHCEERSDAAIHGGFKMTEVGLIPNDWKVKPFKNVATLINGRAFSQSELLERGKYRVLRVGNFGTNDSWYYSNLELPEKMYCNKGDLLYCWSCTYGAYIWNEEKTIYHYHIWKIADLKAEKGYLQYILNNDVAQQMNSSNGSTMSHITKGFLENRLFAFPPTIEEQQRIANALSDVDSLINNLEKLIAKKKNIKQGAMQQLLTGKKRLPGFGGKWSKKVISKLGYTYNGLSGKIASDFGKGSAQYITFLNVLNNPVVDKHLFQKVNVSEVENQNKVLKDDLLFNTSSEVPEEVGICSVLKAEVPNLYLNSFCFGFRLTDTAVDGLFLSYYFRSPLGRSLMSLLAQGSTRYNLSKDNFLKSSIVIPSSKTEQTAIANVLSDMDTEISALETKLAKYRTLKTGMMQQLLTGKVRLI